MTVNAPNRLPLRREHWLEPAEVQCHIAARSGERRAHFVYPVALVAALTLSLLAADWRLGVGIMLLAFACDHLFFRLGSAALILAFLFQWLQVCSVPLYHATTGRMSEYMMPYDYRPTMLLGFVWLLALLLGFLMGVRLLPVNTAIPERPERAFATKTLVISYVLCFVASILLSKVAWYVPGLTHQILAVANLRFILLFLLLLHLFVAERRIGWFLMIVACEAIYCFTGYFAAFRAPLCIAGLVVFQTHGWRKKSGRVLILALGTGLVLAATLWTGIKRQYRAEIHCGQLGSSPADRLTRVGELSQEWFASSTAEKLKTVDAVQERFWMIHHPSLVLKRVPSQVPHTNGRLFARAIHHIFTPRLLFPDKAALICNSDLVRLYAGVDVAGRERGVSIAFPSFAESYVDFGVPLMFLPVFVWGLLLGIAYQWFDRHILHRDLALAFTSVSFWLILFSFERSWSRNLAMAIFLFVVLGGATLLIDRIALRRRQTCRVG